jgi:hypothetical protein
MASCSASHRPSSSRSTSIEKITRVLYHPAGCPTSEWSRRARDSAQPRVRGARLSRRCQADRQLGTKTLDGRLDESTCWSISGIRTADEFFRAVSLLVPDATHMFLEGSPAPDIETLLVDAADETDYLAPIGTIWSWPGKNRRFSVRASSQLFERLAEAASHRAESEVCDHVHFYCGQKALAQWFDAFADPLFVSSAVPRERAERFAAAVGGILR